jgi:predicted PurR-regulated permease PerM
MTALNVSSTSPTQGSQAMNTALQKTAAPDHAPLVEISPEALALVPEPATVTAETPVIHIPVNARGVALAILATVAFVFALQWAQKFFIPLVFSILVSYTLTPVVAWLERIRLPRIVATTLVLLTLLGGAAFVANSLLSEFQSILSRLPKAAHQISQAITAAQDGEPSIMQKMQAVATEIERATSQSSSVKPDARIVPAGVVMAAPAFKVQDWLWAGSMGAAGFVGQATMVLFLIFFLLLSGDSFKRKLVKITGPSMSNKKITVHILDDINKSIQGYMFMLLVTNLLLGAMLWIVFRSVGLENAGAWAIASACVHIIPYFGPVIIAVATGVTAFMQFGSLSTMLLVSGASLAVAMLVGTFITTWMTGRIAKMNAAAVFIGLLFWGWLWGVWGLLLGVPIMVAVRVVSEHVEGMQSVAEVLSE